MNKIGISAVTNVLLVFLFPVNLPAQNDTAWDDSAKSIWDKAFEQVDIPSAIDGNIQKAYLYKATGKTPKPLIVSLHTWSGDYSQKDPVADEIPARNWNYIHPDFRGHNDHPDAMGSSLVISDIEDAILFAVKNTNTDPNDVHITGVSGGGFAALVAYMNIKYPVKSFSAWAPISDIEAWYWESTGRNRKYATDIIHAFSADNTFNREEAVRRSPLRQTFPKEKRKDAKLFIYEGVHDGYTGSVPITHSINMYNRLAGELKYGISDLEKIMPEAASDPDLVSEKEIINLLTKRLNPAYSKETTLFGRNIYLFRQYENIRLTIFEGGHEQIPQALALIPCNSVATLKYNILTLGDSNGQNKGGWVDQMKKMMPGSRIINNSRSGRTIGFDNNGNRDLNALRNIDAYLDAAQQQIGAEKYDYVIVCLGTNDTKNEFSERQNEVVTNFEALLNKIKSHKLSTGSKPKFIFVTPPPVRANNIEYKYQGGNERLVRLMPEFKSIAARMGFTFVDVYHPLQGIFDLYAPDGVHMLAPGQEIVASQIVDAIRNLE